MGGGRILPPVHIPPLSVKRDWRNFIMANLNINGSAKITGTLHGTYTGAYCTDTDSIGSVYDSGWLELPNSPWLNKNYPRGFGNN